MSLELKKNYGLIMEEKETIYQGGAGGTFNYITSYVNNKFKHLLPPDYYFRVESGMLIKILKEINILTLESEGDKPKEIVEKIADKVLDDTFKLLLKKIS